MDYEKIIVALIKHFVDNEGTDYLGEKGERANVNGLSPDEDSELTRLRDIARQEYGWHGYLI